MTRSWRHAAFACRWKGRDEEIGRNVQPVFHSADHGERERSFAGEDFGNPGSTADEGLKVLTGEVLLFHAELDSSDWIGRGDRVMPAFVGIDEGCKYIQLIPFGRARAGAHQVLNAEHGSSVIVSGANGADLCRGLLHKSPFGHRSCRIPDECRAT